MNTQDPLLGQVVLDHFVIERKLGVGAFATAYLAHQLPMERPAVVKITHPHLLTPETSPMIRQRFAAEIRASTRVNHPNLVTLYTTGEVQGVPAFAMEYIEGVSLEQWLEDRAPFDDETMRVLVVQLLSALKALHRAEIIHRDLSPRNIMVSPLSATGELKLTLLDFGVAQLDGHIHHTMGPLGTPRYMAPEQIQGEATSASDMYSFGAILWWMLTGRPYLHTLHSFGDIFKYQLTHASCPDPRQLRPSLSEVDALWLQHLLSVDPAQRPSASEFLDQWRQMRWPHTSARDLSLATQSAEWNITRSDVFERVPQTGSWQSADQTNPFARSPEPQIQAIHTKRTAPLPRMGMASGQLQALAPPEASPSLTTPPSPRPSLRPTLPEPPPRQPPLRQPPSVEPQALSSPAPQTLSAAQPAPQPATSMRPITPTSPVPAAIPATSVAGSTWPHSPAHQALDDASADRTLDVSWLNQQRAIHPEQTTLLVERFMGELPELLSRVHERGPTQVQALDRMQRLARALGARELERLCAMNLALAQHDLIDDQDALTASLEGAYHSVFRALLKHQAHQRLPQ